MMQDSQTMDPQALFLQHKDHLWQMCYRMTGVAADADELVQESFVRLLERPPADLSKPLRPWLVTIALNLARDHLRQRKQRGYPGPWLPSPVASTQLQGAPEAQASSATHPEHQVSLMQSATFAFLLALEVLSPTQRAVLLCRDVFEYSSQETASILSLSDGQVRTILHRARKEMTPVPTHHHPATPAQREALSQIFVTLMTAFREGDKDSLAQLLREDVIMLNDGGGYVKAAMRPILGRDRVLRFFFGLLQRNPPPSSSDILEVNGAPALYSTFPGEDPRLAKHAILRLDLDPHDRIQTFHLVVSPHKLSAITTPQTPPDIKD